MKYYYKAYCRECKKDYFVTYQKLIFKFCLKCGRLLADYNLPIIKLPSNTSFLDINETCFDIKDKD